MESFGMKLQSLLKKTETLFSFFRFRGETAQKEVELNRETFSCSICLDLLKDPVTIPCGHSYCKNCIKSHFDEEDKKKTHSCPDCRQLFTSRPVLVKNTMLAELVEQLEKKGFQAAPDDHCYAEPEDVACDFCTGRKLKAFKSCLFCLASYCEKHLEPHYKSPTFKQHKLVDPSKKLQENICSHHGEVMKMFCRTDQQSICYLCPVDEHKGHDTVSAAAERTERQREVEVRRQNIQQMIQDKEKDVKLLQQELKAVAHSADKTVKDSQEMFTEMIRLLQERSSDVEQQVRSQQETEESRVKEVQEKLQQEITELKMEDAELKQLSDTEDHNQFLHNYPSLSPLSQSTPPSSIISVSEYFEDVKTAPQLGVEDAIIFLLNHIYTYLDKTESTVRVMFFDFSSAFNTIRPALLVVGCISKGDEVEYRAIVDNFVTLCKQNHLQLSVTKTRELVVDLRRTKIRAQTSVTSKKEKLTESLTLRAEMAQRGVELDEETISCSICLDLLKDPVTIPCGHSYCKNCIKGHFDEQDAKQVIHSCPQCRQLFTSRPVLVKSTMLANVVEKLEKTGLQAAPDDHCYAGPEDVACDFCTGRKLKAFKSCLFCLVSYCEKHLQPHYDVAPLKKHKLVDPSKKLQENICSRHDEVMKMFCRTDQQSICYLCSVDEHKGHDIVSAAAERTERQREVDVRRQNIQQMIQDKEKDVKLLQQELKAIAHSADKTVKDSQEIFTEMIRLLQERSSDVEQQVRSQQETEESGVKEVQEKLQQEITELKMEDAELKQLSDTEDHNQFLHNYPSLSPLSQSTHSSSINICPLRNFEDVKAAVIELRKKLEDILRETRTNISLTVTEVDVLLPQPEPKTRDEFLKYSCEITLDQNTAHKKLVLSERNRKVTVMMMELAYPDHPDRFTANGQVLSRESLTGRCYWEVEKGVGGISVAVAYKDNNSENEKFGENDKSWALGFYKSRYNFRHNNIQTPVSGPPSSRVGVYLDHRAGILSFYSISETMTLLHRVQTTFTQPLYAGLWINGPVGNTAKLGELEQKI
ncbi:E3 ubiquitin/ISG15 ligase TRIM25-like [Mugil cephalus]|uniref:E3 ubiquitin/ISG15 ligase TRIM25-like n=1 Tax=Mugil cephalus TaxID=48193 RepID=UPI001FB77128|nr:E3 ubiquitin/ISG15 ligase TRIM25-like [Mugil cephalus]